MTTSSKSPLLVPTSRMRRATRRRFVFVLVQASLVVFFVLACSRGRRPSDPACVHWVEASMSWAERCGVPLGIGLPSVPESRRHHYEALCERGIFAPGATRARTYFDQCATRLETRECSLPYLFECDSPPGELPDNTACAFDFQCASGWCKHDLAFDGDFPRLPTCGICTARIAIGDTCNEARFEKCSYGAQCRQFRCETEPAVEHERCSTPGGCANGLRCEPGSTRDIATCERRLPVGSACVRSSDCAGGLVCAGPPGTGEVDAGPLYSRFPPFEPIEAGTTPLGICRELRAGESCSTRRGCLRGLGCDPDERICVPIKYVAGDEACDDNVRRCKSVICVHADFFSPEPLPTNMGICPVALDDNAPCGGNELCELPATCSVQTGRCELPDPTTCK